MVRNGCPLLNLVSACALAWTSAQAQGFWASQRPVPTGSMLYAIKALDKDRVFATGDFGQVFSTTDGGSTWKLTETGAAFSLRGLSAGSPDVLFAVGDSGSIIATSDGGATWRAQAGGAGAALRSVSAVNAKVAFACGAKGVVLKTTDGGDTWARLETGTALNFRSISAVDGQVAYVTTTRDTLFKTSDGGATWQKQYLGEIRGMNENGAGLQGVSAIHRDTVFVAALDVVSSIPRGAVYRTVDGGAHWARIDSSGGNISYGISAVDGRNIFVSGFSNLFATHDGGATWIEKSIPRVAAGYVQSNDAISAIDGLTAFTTGSAGIIYVTTDGGQSWSPKPGIQSRSALWDIKAVGKNLAFASGASGLFLSTTDGGANWREQTLNNTNTTIQSIDTRDGRVILAANGSSILRSADGGATWTPASAPTIPYPGLQAVSLADGGIAFTAGGSGTLMKSTDAGVTWTPLASGTLRNLTVIQALTPSLAFAAGDSGILLRTQDGGARWDSLPTGTRKSIRSMHFLNASIGYISGNAGLLRKTLDGGAHWDSLPAPNWFDPVYAVRAVDEKTAYICGYWHMLKTTDGGSTWARETARSTSTLNAIAIVDGSTAYAAGAYGSIVKYTGRNVSISPRVGVFPLSWHIHRGILHVDLPSAGRLTGRILDARGRTLSRPDWGRLDQGGQTVPIPSLRGGPYVLELRFGGARKAMALPRP